MHKPQRVLAKRYAAGLRECQEEDLRLPAPCMFSIRYYLPRLTSKFQPIRVETDAMEGHTYVVDRQLVPEFILSQLESQKLIPTCMPQIPISPLLDVVLRIFHCTPVRAFPRFSAPGAKSENDITSSSCFLGSRCHPSVTIRLSTSCHFANMQSLSLLRQKLLEDDPELGKCKACRMLWS